MHGATRSNRIMEVQWRSSTNRFRARTQQTLVDFLNVELNLGRTFTQSASCWRTVKAMRNTTNKPSATPPVPLDQSVAS